MAALNEKNKQLKNDKIKIKFVFIISQNIVFEEWQFAFFANELLKSHNTFSLNWDVTKHFNTQ